MDSNEITHAQPYSTKLFHYDGSKKQLSAEASGLPQFNGNQSLRVVSARTSVEVVYLLSRVEKDREGDILAWHYNPTGPATKTKLIVFND